MTCKFLRTSTRFRTAVTSLVVGFLSAVVLVEAVFLAGEWLSTITNRVYVDGDPERIVDDGFPIARHLMDDWETKFQRLQRAAGQDRISAAARNDNKLASLLSDTIRIVCCVLTSSGSLRSRSASIRSTWGRRCSKLIFVSDNDDDDDGESVVRVNSQSRVIGVFDHLYRNHVNDYDWFLQVDDETYVIMENLRYFLTSISPNDPVHFRHHFSAVTQRGYLRTGVGYMLSKETLMRLGNRPRTVCPLGDSIEDRSMNRCLGSLGSRTADSRDLLGRSRFHCFSPETHIHGLFPSWYARFNRNGNQIMSGIDSISDYAILFHFIRQEQFIELEFYIYHLRPYGFVAGLQHLNRVQRHLNDTPYT